MTTLATANNNWQTPDVNNYAGNPPNAGDNSTGGLNVIGVAVDFDAGTITIYKLGGTAASPTYDVVVTGTGLGAGTWYPFMITNTGIGSSASDMWNALVTHEESMMMPLPSGYSAWDAGGGPPPAPSFWTGFVQAVET